MFYLSLHLLVICASLCFIALSFNEAAGMGYTTPGCTELHNVQHAFSFLAAFLNLRSLLLKYL